LMKEWYESPNRVESFAVSQSSGPGTTPGNTGMFEEFLGRLGGSLRPSGEAPQHHRKRFDPRARQARQVHELDRHNQQLLTESPYVRAQFMSKLDPRSL